MENPQKQPNLKIKITKDGPYKVTGHIPLYEKIITRKGKGYVLKPGRDLPQSEEYALCRCGRSKNAPFCDGSHIGSGFIGTETASMNSYEERAEFLEGQSIDLLDDYRCALGRFCHRESGNAWELAINSDSEENKREAIQAANECPSGRLVVQEKSGQVIEPEYTPAIEVVQDPEKHVSAALYVKGNIPIESANGWPYEVRNRVALCRCGKSRNKPFCDATHITVNYSDSQK
ncbi:hypothetical protein SDC9_73657 [bioreactor metagenome]|uniref:Iron-binding zinc finger CDGSH type domain-containing protein n=1 Tax=bioreactor metagenome TaxID=1076179 RepID=A0A644YFC9_9ZZZZ